MSIETKADSRISLPEWLMDKSNTRTRSLFKDSVFNDATNTFREHLKKELVQPDILDECMMFGLQVVQRQDREMHSVAPTLQILLQFGAQWKDGTLLEHQMTPYHLICKSIGDHYELLDLLIKTSGRTLIDTKDKETFTALLYAAQNANINCVRTLITHGADVNITTCNNYSQIRWHVCEGGPKIKTQCSPLVVTLASLVDKRTQSTIITIEILDLLLESGADVNLPSSKSGASPINIAIFHRNVECIVKLIRKGAQLNTTTSANYFVWAKAASLGSVEILKCMFENGLDKDCIDPLHSKNLLSYAVESKSVAAVRYLVDLGVTFPNFTPKREFKLCSICETKILHFNDHDLRDPCMQAVRYTNPELVQLLKEHDNQSFKSFKALQNAVSSSNLGTVEYLLSKYTYPINDEYMAYYSGETCLVLLNESCSKDKVEITKLLLDHGADPNKKICNGKGSSVLIEATYRSHAAIIALFIRNGVDINFRSYDRNNGYVLPFEASILNDRLYAAEMLLVSGCSCGVYSLGSSDLSNIKSDLKDLMEKWHVQENNVIPLKQQCRRMLLNLLSPQADRKIMKLPLPSGVIRYLSISELDDILEACSKAPKRNPYIFDNQLVAFNYQLKICYDSETDLT